MSKKGGSGGGVKKGQKTGQNRKMVKNAKNAKKWVPQPPLLDLQVFF